MHESLLRIDREEEVFYFLIFVIILWILSCFRSGFRKSSGDENSAASNFTETFNIRKSDQAKFLGGRKYRFHA